MALLFYAHILRLGLLSKWCINKNSIFLAIKLWLDTPTYSVCINSNFPPEICDFPLI